MKFLIVRTDKLGDSLLTLPVAAKLKEKFPESLVYFLASSYTAPIIAKSIFVDEVIASDKTSFFDLAEILRRKKIDYAIVARPTLRNALLVYFAGIKYRIGTKFRAYSFLFNKRVAHHRKESKKHEALYNLDLIEPVGIPNSDNLDDVKFGLVPEFEWQEKVRRKLRKFGIDLTKPLMVMHISSGGSAVDWNYLNFKQLARMIKANTEAEIILTGTNKDFLFLYELFLDFDYRVYNLAGELNLVELFNLFSLVDIYIGNSTGPTHLAAIAGCWVISFYPKIKVASQVRWGPITKKRIIFEPEIDCSDCTQEQCMNLNCMDSISVEKVFKEVYKIITKTEWK
ncbi:MAG: glycosyltransferase family 9 protein [Ignavibacteria bacterium]|jgi:ADP-heptose:LPS heptosyltransferase|nr:glycosyltransferase family 9 protein [Ignavibacteria bacterium]MDH7526648.1 glycosyltransferase family 9 protein [Ignavibacteria bacterium]